MTESTSCTAPRPIEILMIEDSDTDVLLTRKSFERSKMLLNLHVAKDGVEGLKFLRKEPPYEAAAAPDLILLDLNLPRKDGREVLAEIKTDEALKMIPVVVLTTSEAEDDRLKSYMLHANCYVTKPVEFTNFNKTVQEIGHFWFQVVSLPQQVTVRGALSGVDGRGAGAC